MVTAIERLRELLDERGVDYRVSATGYSIDIGPYTTAYANRSDTMLDVSLRQVTPEQAIAATLGAGQATDEWGDGFRAGCDAANKASEESVEHYKAENAKLRKLAVGMYGMLEMFDTLLGNHDACETPRPLVFGEDKSFKDAMRELGIEVD